jgi:hypothetical protein
MRDTKNVLESLMPMHEKEWDARLFIDSAIKGNADRQLQIIARALSGRHPIRFERTPDEGYVSTKHQKDEHGNYFKVVENFKILAKMDKYIFYGNSNAEIWLKIIGFWLVKETVFPCGGAAFPCNRAEVVFKQE